MLRRNTYGLQLLAQLTSIGEGGSETREFLFDHIQASPLTECEIYSPCGSSLVGMIQHPLPELSERGKGYESRVTRIANALLTMGAKEIDVLKGHYAPDRIGVVIGSSTSGIERSERAFHERTADNLFPAWYHYSQQEIGAISAFISATLEVTGPSCTISTACSSSAKAIAVSRTLLAANMCDVVITGGIDSLCQLTIGGFSSLGLVSPTRANPFSKNRNGLNIGEGGALFLLTKAKHTPLVLRGIGEASDAYHISSPHPDALGMKTAIMNALQETGESPEKIGYFNLHGTGTMMNDRLEALSVHSTVGSDIPCSSTKPLTGHTLGAAGAIELAFCSMALETGKMPIHYYDGEYDPEISHIRLVKRSETMAPGTLALSTSFAFGGSNCCVAIGTR